VLPIILMPPKHLAPDQLRLLFDRSVTVEQRRRLDPLSGLTLYATFKLKLWALQ
jgi:hypothetical protein